MITGDHWYKNPESCADCGKPPTDPTHFRGCGTTWSFGPGFAFCRDPQGHDFPHHLVNWDGCVYLVHEDNTTEKTDEIVPRWPFQ